MGARRCCSFRLPRCVQTCTRPLPSRYSFQLHSLSSKNSGPSSDGTGGKSEPSAAPLLSRDQSAGNGTNKQQTPSGAPSTVDFGALREKAAKEAKEGEGRSSARGSQSSKASTLWFTSHTITRGTLLLIESHRSLTKYQEEWHPQRQHLRQQGRRPLSPEQEPSHQRCSGPSDLARLRLRR